MAEPGPPADAPLTRADRGCPRAPAQGRLLVANARDDAAGELELRRLDVEEVEPEALSLAAGDDGHGS